MNIKILTEYLTLLYSVVLINLISCTPVQKGLWITNSPSSERELGTIVDQASSQKVHDLVREGKINARVLSENSGTYEIYGLDEAEVKKEFPAASIESNRFFSYIDTSNINSNLDQIKFENFTIHLKIIDAYKAWKFSKGKNITVAVIDTGLNYQHNDFYDKLDLNIKDPINGFDDDNNGFVDDYWGWNFGDNTNDITDNSNHGTSVSGIINTNSIGIAPDSKIIPIKVINKNKKIDEASVLAALKYVMLNTHAQIINMSIGKMNVSPLFNKVLKELDDAGILIVASTGDVGINCAQMNLYPASSQLPNTISVGASVLDFENPLQLASYSNFGSCVDLVAPAGDLDNGIATPIYENKISNYIVFNGTSAAAPIVSGVAALVKSLSPHLKPVEVKQILFKGSIPLKFKKLSKYGLINANNSLELLQTFPKNHKKNK